MFHPTIQWLDLTYFQLDLPWPAIGHGSPCLYFSFCCRFVCFLHVFCVFREQEKSFDWAEVNVSLPWKYWKSTKLTICYIPIKWTVGEPPHSCSGLQTLKTLSSSYLKSWHGMNLNGLLLAKAKIHFITDDSTSNITIMPILGLTTQWIDTDYPDCGK